MAAKTVAMSKNPIFNLPWLAKKPAVNSKVSPGKKNPISSPDSAKTIAATNKTPPLCNICSGLMPISILE